MAVDCASSFRGAGLIVGNEWRRTERAELDVAGDEIVDRRSAAPVRHLFERDTGELRVPQRHHGLGRADATSGTERQAGLLLRQRGQFGKRADAERRMRREQNRLARNLDAILTLRNREGFAAAPR